MHRNEISTDPAFNFTLFGDPANTLGLAVNNDCGGREDTKLGDTLEITHFDDASLNPFRCYRGDMIS